MFGLFFRPKFQGISPENMVTNIGTNVNYCLQVIYMVLTSNMVPSGELT